MKGKEKKIGIGEEKIEKEDERKEMNGIEERIEEKIEGWKIGIDMEERKKIEKKKCLKESMEKIKIR